MTIFTTFQSQTIHLFKTLKQGGDNTHAIYTHHDQVNRKRVIYFKCVWKINTAIRYDMLPLIIFNGAYN